MESRTLHVEGYTQIGVGLAFIVASLLCKLGAEQHSRANTSEGELNGNK